MKLTLLFISFSLLAIKIDSVKIVDDDDFVSNLEKEIMPEEIPMKTPKKDDSDQNMDWNDSALDISSNDFRTKNSEFDDENDFSSDFNKEEMPDYIPMGLPKNDDSELSTQWDDPELEMPEVKSRNSEFDDESSEDEGDLFADDDDQTSEDDFLADDEGDLFTDNSESTEDDVDQDLSDEISVYPSDLTENINFEPEILSEPRAETEQAQTEDDDDDNDENSDYDHLVKLQDELDDDQRYNIKSFYTDPFQGKRRIEISKDSSEDSRMAKRAMVPINFPIANDIDETIDSSEEIDDETAKIFWDTVDEKYKNDLGLSSSEEKLDALLDQAFNSNENSVEEDEKLGVLAQVLPVNEEVLIEVVPDNSYRQYPMSPSQKNLQPLSKILAIDPPMSKE